MDVSKLRTFLGWCCVLNFGLILISSLFLLAGPDWLNEMLAKFLSIPSEGFSGLWFTAIGLYKVLVLVFNLIPYIALRIMGRTMDSTPTVLP